jgi:acyl dehydratase
MVSLAQYQSRVGSLLGVSEWIAVDQGRIDAFATTTLDRQAIHVDPVVARSSPFGGTVAHGFLTLSLLSAMASEALPALQGMTMSVNYGFNSLRFVAPVRSGARVRGRFFLKAVTERSPGVVQSTLGVTVEIEKQEKPAIVAEWLALYYLQTQDKS